MRCLLVGKWAYLAGVGLGDGVLAEGLPTMLEAVRKRLSVGAEPGKVFKSLSLYPAVASRAIDFGLSTRIDCCVQVP